MTIPKNQLDFIERAVSMQDPESEQFSELAFWARVWVQATLPHSNPGKRNTWSRTNGAFTLSVQPFIEEVNGVEVNYGIPYGSIPRLLMCWMCSEAIRTGERKLYLGNSLTQFMKNVEIGEATGGRWGSITRLKEQMKRLFSARISCTWADGHDADVRESLQIASKENIWWSHASPDQPTLFESYIILDHDFFQEIMTRPVPIKLEALRLLKKSPLGLDLYTWLTYRVFALRRPTHIPWSTLEKQLGADYASTNDFARKCKKVLKLIHAVYPDLRIETPRGRLVVKPSPTHVKRRLAR